MVKEIIYEKSSITFFSIAFILGLFFSFYQVPLKVLFFLIFLLFLLFFKNILHNKYLLLYLALPLLFYQIGNFYFKNSFFEKKLNKELLIEIKEVNPWYSGYIVSAYSKSLGNFRFKIKNLDLFPGQTCLLFLDTLTLDTLTSNKPSEFLNPFYLEKDIKLKAFNLVDDLGFLKKEQYLCSEEKSFNLNYLRFSLLEFSEKLNPVAKGLFQALVLGIEINLPQEYIEKLKSQGLYHNLAISGFNLAVVYLIFYKAIKLILSNTFLLRLGYPIQLWAYFLALPGAFLVLLFSGFSPPALRAFVMLLLFIFTKLLWIETSSFILLLLGITLILIFEPYLVGNVSFQLSVISTLGIILGDRIFNQWSKNLKLEFYLKNFLLKILQAFIISLSISFLTFPLLIYYTGFFPITMPINNIIATPFWSFIFIPFSILGAFISFLNEDLAIFLLNFLANIFNFYIKIPFFEINFYPSFPVNLILFAIVFTIFVTIFLNIFLKFNKFQHVFIINLIIYFLTYKLIKTIYNILFFVTIFDVGKANAILLKSDSFLKSAYFLFDTGPDFPNSSFSWTKIYLVPSLKKLGVKNLELIVISHPDLDHSGGLSVFKKEFLVNKVVSGKFKEIEWKKANLTLLPEEITHVQALKFPSFELFFFPGNFPYEELNRESLVTYIEHQNGLTILIPGDIDIIRFYRLKERKELLPVEILLAPHHGSNKGLNKEILEKLRPQVVIVSGRSNNFPHFETVKLLNSMGIFWITTEKEGAISIFPKKDYFLVCSEKEKRKNFFQNWLFPFIPALIEFDYCFKFAYHKN